jgi:hypothetical protein
MISVSGSSTHNSRDVGLSDIFPGEKFHSIEKLGQFINSFPTFISAAKNIVDSSKVKSAETSNALYGTNLDAKVGERFIEMLK